MEFGIREDTSCIWRFAPTRAEALGYEQLQGLVSVLVLPFDYSVNSKT